MSGITLLGLGPGNPDQLTREAWNILSTADEIWCRTRQHPTLDAIPPSVRIHSFDDLYENNDSFHNVYATIVDKVMDLGRRSQGVIYAVPGHPFVAETTGPKIYRLALDEGLATRVIEGLSFLESTFSALGLDPYPRLTLFDALELSVLHVPPFPPDTPVLIAQIYSSLVAAEVKMTLNAVYPDKHPVRLIHAAGTKEESVQNMMLYEIDRSKDIGLLTSLYIEPLGKETSFESFQEIIAHLRAPDGCPWDREQTHQSLRTNMLEETYEVLAAIDAGDPKAMQEEFGDLLLQIVLHAQIANEAGNFSINSILKNISGKMIRRHPHVFGDLEIDNVAGVLKNWEKMKAAERKSTKNNNHPGLLASVPPALPALTLAQEYQNRAGRVGFDWPSIDGVVDKIREEISEIQEAKSEENLAEEIGDLFFVLVNFARWKNIDAESVLRETNYKFKQRFEFLEEKAAQQGKIPSDMSLDEMNAVWEQAKKL